MKNETPIIIGAGFTGLIAAHAWPSAPIFEKMKSPFAAHKALMRFRTDAVSKLTGVEFRKVTVRKGIFYRGAFVAPNVRVANLYAQKVIGRVVDRSIWNIDPVERFIAPEDFYEQLIDAVGNRIEWDSAFTPSGRMSRPVVTTAPLPATISTFKVDQLDLSFNRAPVRVARWRVPDADVFQTVYFPDPSTPIYRASITGSMLIIESNAFSAPESEPLRWVEDAFGIDAESLEPIDTTEQKYGKVDELPARDRKRILYELTSKWNIYSLGRFATWRNILLDDVVDDIAVIKRLIKSGSVYDARKVAA